MKRLDWQQVNNMMCVIAQSTLLDRFLNSVCIRRKRYYFKDKIQQVEMRPS